MRKLIRITMANAVQFEQPLGVQKIISTKVGPIHRATFEEMKNGDVLVRVVGSKYPYEHVIHREHVVEKLYEVDMLAEVLPLDHMAVGPISANGEGPLVTPAPKQEHWKTRQKRERDEAAKAASGS